MSVADGSLRAAFTLCLVSLLAACSADGGARECTTEASCGTGSRCTEGLCVVNRPPVASVAVPSGIEAFAVVTLDGSASSDPDPGDAVASHAWRILPVDAPCAGPTIAGAAATAQARFGCPGRFAVELTAFDTLGAPSLAALQEVEVLPSTAPPVVTAAPDVVVGHRCAGEPLVCTVDTPTLRVALGALVAEPRPRLRWVVSPPAFSPGGARQVTFDPSPEVPSPEVSIETDGSAISGDWVFRIEAYDDLGVLGAAAMRVSVTNHPPVIEAVTGPLPHAFDRAASRFTAAGEIQVIGYDVDGDPLDRQLTARAVSTGPATFAVVDLGDRITFSIQVPYAAPSDAGYLIGGPGLERSISLVLRDPNGGEARETWPIVVENRPPTLRAAAPVVAVNHRFDPETRAYRAEAPLARWTDPEDDPLFAEGPTGDLVCPELSMADDGRAWVACSLAYVGTPALHNFAGRHTITALARDPWAPAAEPSTSQVDIMNRAPTLLPRSYSVATGCGLGSCCVGSGATCDHYTTFEAATLHAEGFVDDPDGDPLTVTSAVATTVCEPPACALDVRLESGRVCVMEPGGDAPFTASDGVATLSAGVQVAVECTF